MKYGINNWIYDDEPIRDTFTRLSRFGYDGIELKGEPALYNVAEIKALCQEFSMQVTSVLGWNIWGIPGRDLSSPDDGERQAAVQFLKECIDFTAAVEAPILLVLPAPAGRTAPNGNPQSEDAWVATAGVEWRNAVDSVGQGATYAIDKKVILAVEPINRFETYMITTVDHALRFVSEVGANNVKLNLDAFHMNIDEVDLPGAVRKAGELLAHMHIADSNREAPGRGHTDFHALMKALKEINFAGSIVLEPVPPGAEPGMAIKLSQNLPLREVYADEAIRYLKDIEKTLHTS